VESCTCSLCTQKAAEGASPVTSNSRLNTTLHFPQLITCSRLFVRQLLLAIGPFLQTTNSSQCCNSCSQCRSSSAKHLCLLQSASTLFQPQVSASMLTGCKKQSTTHANGALLIDTGGLLSTRAMSNRIHRC
jgi:hypothetical protein